MAIFHYITLSTLTDGDNMISLTDGLPELPGIDLCINPVVELRIAQEDKVMDSNHTADAALMNAPREFSREAMVQLHSVLLQILHNTMGTPDGLVKWQVTILRIAERQSWCRKNLFTQVVTSLVRSIEIKAHTTVQSDDIVDESTSITTETCGIAHNALGIISDYHCPSA